MTQTNHPNKQALLKLLAANELEDLFQALKEQQGYRDLVLLESQWNELRAQQRNGTISDDQANVELSRIREALLELIERSGGSASATPPPAANRTWLWVALAGAALLAVYLFYTRGATDAGVTAGTAGQKPAASAPAAGSRALDVSGAPPITLAPGDAYDERIYTVVKTSSASTGGGKSLITITVGLNFKGKTNAAFGTDKFRLVAEELPGPLAPANFFSDVVDPKSCAEREVKFELSDQIRRFSVIVEDKEDKKWNFSRQ